MMSLGGSVIIPSATDQIDFSYLKAFKKLIASIRHKKFVIATGGGSTARKYMKVLEQEGFDKKIQCLMGISVTRLHAKFMADFFDGMSSQSIPRSVQEVKGLLKKNKVVFVGGLRYEEDNTSDGTAARIAQHLKTDFINITDVEGLYTKDPRKHKDAKLYSSLTYDEAIEKHLEVMDQAAFSLCRDQKLPIVVFNFQDRSNLMKAATGKKVGTLIHG